MTDYVWRNAKYESVIKKQITRQILSIILSFKKELKKEQFTKAEVYNKGKRERIHGFPTSPITILRALNSMSLPDVGILEKKEGRPGCKNQYSLIKSPFPFEELIVENEIAELKGISKRCLSDGKKFGTSGYNYNDIIADESITIYGFPNHNFNKFEKEFNEIKTKMKKAMEDLYELAVRSRLDIFYEKIHGLFNKPWGWEKFYNRHVKRNKNHFEIMKDPEIIEAFSKIGHPSEGDVSPLDMEFSAVFLHCLISGQLNRWFDLQKTPIGIKRDMGLDLAEVFHENFYPSKGKDKILSMLQSHKIDSGLSEELKSLVDFFYHYLFPIDHLIAVIHGGSTGRADSFSSLHQLIYSEQIKAYRRLSEKYPSEKMKFTPDEILERITH